MSVFLFSRTRLWLCGFSLSLSALVASPAAGHVGTVSPNTANITIEQLLVEMAEPAPQRSDAIDMYLLGIFDATEGRGWCDYRRFKLGTLRSEVYSALRSMQGAALQQRAAPAVIAVLAQRFPCSH